SLDYTGLNNRSEMHGTSGFYTQEQYIVVVNDTPETIDGNTASIDVYCAQGGLTNPWELGGTGLGFGKFTERFDGEIIAYCHGSTPTSPSTNVNSRGYGVAQINGSVSYPAMASIISVRNKAAGNGQELIRNTLKIDNTEVGVPQFQNYNNRRYWLGR